MPPNMENVEMLLTVLSSEYMEKIFYFYLKRTGEVAEAEDLTSDTTLCILHELRKGTVPESFSAWVWRIARNRYSLWADKKHKNRNSISAGDISEMDITDDSFIEENLLQKEDIKLLRRELAFVSQNYRDVLVAYYIDGQSVRDISLSLNCAEGTIKARLFRSRKLLKEGIEMAREFGIKSYKPEDVDFAATGSQPVGLPWNVVQRKIPKNILLHAHNNPSTVEELAIEIGIALPYMEEESAILENATLLKKLDNDKYITNFFIADAQCQTEVYQASRLYSKERSELLDKLVCEILPDVKKHGIIRNGMNDDDFKWLLSILTCDFFIQHVKGYDITCRVNRNGTGDWGFMGFEKFTITEPLAMGHNGNGDYENSMFWAYKISDYKMWNRVGEMYYPATLLLADIIRNNRRLSSLSPAELDTWQSINGKFAHVENDIIIPDIAVFEKGVMEKYQNLVRNHALHKSLSEKYQAIFDNIMEILKKHANPVLLEQLHFYASMFILNNRMMLVHDEVEAGRLIIPENPETSTVAMWIVLSK